MNGIAWKWTARGVVTIYTWKWNVILNSEKETFLLQNPVEINSIKVDLDPPLFWAYGFGLWRWGWILVFCARNSCFLRVVSKSDFQFRILLYLLQSLLLFCKHVWVRKVAFIMWILWKLVNVRKLWRTSHFCYQKMRDTISISFFLPCPLSAHPAILPLLLLPPVLFLVKHAKSCVC